jgi:hypothetical protein
MPGINTAGDLIAFCLRTASITGVGQTPSAEDSNDGLILLQAMLGQWQRKRWLVWSLGDTACVATGNPTYSIGAGMDFPVPRPERISSAYARFLPVSGTNSVDYPLEIIDSREDWNAVTLKGLHSIPLALFYESAFPNALLHVWPIPPAGIYELHISAKAALPYPLVLTDPIAAPPEYMEAMIYSLAVRLSMNYGQQPSPANVNGMRAALNTIRIANAQISTQEMPTFGSGSGGLAAGSDPAFETGGIV